VTAKARTVLFFNKDTEKLAMKTKFVMTLAAVLCLALAGAANAVTVVTLLGDQDGFGLGVPGGAGFDFDAIGSGDGDGTDVWHDGNLTFTLDYARPAAITAASVELFSGGFGLDASPRLYLNGTFVGLLSDGDDVGPLYNYAFKDVVDLTPFAALLTGHDLFEIRLATGPDDSGVLDYAQLTVAGDAIAAVPELATNALLSAGLIALAALQRRTRRPRRAEPLRTDVPPADKGPAPQ
jgi:hypothetical protein